MLRRFAIYLASQAAIALLFRFRTLLRYLRVTAAALILLCALAVTFSETLAEVIAEYMWERIIAPFMRFVWESLKGVLKHG
jgi:hypothetical protein